MTIDYEALMNGSWDDIPQPKMLPDGTWKLKLKGAAFKPSSQEGKSSTVLFIYAPKEAMDDVDAAALAALGDDYDLDLNKVFVRFWVESADDWNQVRRHLGKHGVKTEGKSIVASFKEAKGSEIFAFITTRDYVNGQGIEVTENAAAQFAPVE